MRYRTINIPSIDGNSCCLYYSGFRHYEVPRYKHAFLMVKAAVYIIAGSDIIRSLTIICLPLTVTAPESDYCYYVL